MGNGGISRSNSSDSFHSADSFASLPGLDEDDDGAEVDFSAVGANVSRLVERMQRTGDISPLTFSSPTRPASQQAQVDAFMQGRGKISPAAMLWRQLSNLLEDLKSGTCAGYNDDQARGLAKRIALIGGVAAGASLGAIFASFGLAAGGATGVALGVVPAVFTAGLSIPAGLMVGSAGGIVLGLTLGVSTGLFGGGALLGVVSLWWLGRQQLSPPVVAGRGATARH